tara:strand:+ start:72 stop:341 length:270 start_codon:yes stop_codon:yes gene_type:complete
MNSKLIIAPRTRTEFHPLHNILFGKITFFLLAWCLDRMGQNIIINDFTGQVILTQQECSGFDYSSFKAFLDATGSVMRQFHHTQSRPVK